MHAGAYRVALRQMLLRSCLVFVAALPLVACTSSHKAAQPRVVHRLPPPYVPPPYRPSAKPARPVAAPYRPAQSAYTPSAPLSGSNEALLRLRGGLNVAALSCRGGGVPAITPSYSRLLTRHRTLLASAYQAERQRLGVAGLDRQQTRLYNRFANQRSPRQFCQSAADIAARASSMDSANLRPAAPRLASELEARLR